MSGLQITADSCAKDLRLGLSDWVYPSARIQLLTDMRAAMAQALATDETGVTLSLARLVSTERPCDLTAAMVQDARLYHDALIHHYQVVNALDYSGLLLMCDRIGSGERRAA